MHFLFSSAYARNSSNAFLKTPTYFSVVWFPTFNEKFFQLDTYRFNQARNFRRKFRFEWFQIVIFCNPKQRGKCGYKTGLRSEVCKFFCSIDCWSDRCKRFHIALRSLSISKIILSFPTVFCKVATKILDLEGLAASLGIGASLRLRDFKNSLLYSLNCDPQSLTSSKNITGRVFVNGTLTVTSLQTFDVQPIVEWVNSQISSLCLSRESSIFSGRSDAYIFKISAHICMSLPFCVEFESLLKLFETKPTLGKFQCTAIRSQLPCGQGPMFSFGSPTFGTLTATVFRTGKCQVRGSGMTTNSIFSFWNSKQLFLVQEKLAFNLKCKRSAMNFLTFWIAM